MASGLETTRQRVCLDSPKARQGQTPSSGATSGSTCARRPASPLLAFIVQLHRQLPHRHKILILFVLAQVCLASSPLLLATLLDTLSDQVRSHRVWTILGAMIAVWGLGQIALRGMELRTYQSTRAFEERLRLRVWAKLNSVPAACLEGRHSGVLMNKLFRDIMILANSTTMVIQGVWGTLLVTLASLAWAIFCSWPLALLIGIMLPVGYLMYRHARAPLQGANDAFRSRGDGLAVALVGFLDLLPLIRVMAAQDDCARRIRQEVADYRQSGLALDRANWAFVLLVTVTMEASQLLVLVGVTYLCWRGRMTVGGALLDYLLYAQVISRLVGLIRIAPQVELVFGSVLSLREVLDEEDEPLPESPLALTSIEQVEVEGVDFAYGDGTSVLRDVSFCVRRGQILGITGECGSGKSTLCRVLLGQYAPRRGLVRINGQPFDTVNRASLYEKVAIVPQHVALFPGSLRDNLALMRKSLRDAEIVNTLRDVGLGDFLSRQPDGLDTLVVSGMGFSGGERQKLGIARALLRHPELLVLDEVSNNLDASSREEILRIIRKVSQERLVILVSHDERLIELAQVTVHLVPESPRPRTNASQPSSRCA